MFTANIAPVQRASASPCSCQRGTLTCVTESAARASEVLAVASVPVGIRLPREVWARHSAAAQELGLPLSVYLRRRLDREDSTAVALAELQAALERQAAAPPERGEAPASKGLFVELLLLLRQVAGPQRAGLAQREVERRGLPVWK